MSTYLTAFAILLMAISPVLIPAVITAVHLAIDGVRAVTDQRRSAPATSLS